MIPLEMKPKIIELHNDFFKDEFKKEFIYMFMKDRREFNFEDEISEEFKELLIEAKKEYQDKKKKYEKIVKEKGTDTKLRSICNNLSIKEDLIYTKEFVNLFKLIRKLFYFLRVWKENRQPPPY